MTQKDIIRLIFNDVDETGELPKSEEENEAFNDIITYLTDEGFILSETGKDEHYSEISSMLLYHNHVSLMQGFEHGFKTALSLVGRDTEQIGEAVRELF